MIRLMLARWRAVTVVTGKKNYTILLDFLS